MIIKLKDFTSEAASKSKGTLLKKKLDTALKNGCDISVDFANITKYASPFFNNSFSALAIIYGIDKIANIKLINMSDNGKIVFNSSIDNVRFLMGSMNIKDQIEDITNNALEMEE